MFSKLISYGMHSHANTFLRSYLLNRTQFTVVNGAKFGHNISCGVPQGSALFPLYINYLCMAEGSDSVRPFADDTVIFMHNTKLKNLINYINNKNHWTVSLVCTQWINNKWGKTYFVLFHAINEPLPQNFHQIKTGLMDVTRDKTFQYLGVYLNETSKLIELVDIVFNSFIKYFGIFNHIKNKVSKPIMRQHYYAFIYSKAKYGVEVCGNTSARNISRIQVIQNKFLKLILSWDWQTPTNFLHSDLKIPKVEDIYISNKSNFNRYVMGRIPEIL